MKEELANAILLAITGKSAAELQMPLGMELSSELALHLQTFRYMLALYAEKSKGIDKHSCPESFAHYLKAAMKLSNDMYAWTKDDRAYYKKLFFKPKQFEMFSEMFSRVKKALAKSPHLVRFFMQIF